MQLALPAVPKESPLREAFRRAQLGLVGLDFRSVHGDPRGARLLRAIAGAYERGHELAARAYARRLADMRRDLA
jgi:hypothetical protein